MDQIVYTNIIEEESMGKVIEFPQNKLWTISFIIPDEISMEGQSKDIHWTFEHNYGTAEVKARTLKEAKQKILDCIEIDSWCDIGMEYATEIE
tara:strand:+ start:204 stop:482 length:279 start_codon:yes stop_codon:yes gene_type:complete